MVRKKVANGEPLAWIISHLGHDADACLIWPFGRTAAGYGTFGQYYAHREMCERAHGPAPAGLLVAMHSCGNGHLGCVHPKHLHGGTHSDNTQDMWRHGTMAAGTAHPGAKLTEGDVRAIRSMAGTASESDIADRFGISGAHTHRIIARQRWKWLD